MIQVHLQWLVIEVEYQPERGIRHLKAEDKKAIIIYFARLK